MGLLARFDGFQRRHRLIGFPLAVVYKYFDDQGNYLAALIAYYGFLAIIPLLLLLTTILGVVLHGDQHLQNEVLDSALRQFPVIGDSLKDPAHLGGGIGFVVGIAGAAYGGLGVAQAAQNAMNIAWAVPRNRRPNPFKARGRSFLLLGTVGLAVIASTALTALSDAGGLFGTTLRAVVIVLTFLLNVGLFWLAFRIATARDLSPGQVLPGAVLAAVVWQALQSGASSYVKHVVSKAHSVNGTFAFILGLFAFLYLASVAMVFCVEFNVVRSKRLYPRSLLTPFTDRVHLTAADRRAYADMARAQQFKGFQEVGVAFRPDEDPVPDPVGPGVGEPAGPG